MKQSHLVRAAGLMLALTFTMRASAQEDVVAPSGSETPAEKKAAKPAKPQKSEEEERLEAWQEALRKDEPLTVEQVEEYKNLKNALDEARKPREAPLQASSDAITVSTQPGAVSPRVTLLHGFVTAIEILDSTGQPWPVLKAVQGDPEAVDVKVQGAEAVAVASPAPQASAFGVTGGEDIDLAAPASAPAAVMTSNTHVITVNPIRRFAATNLVVLLAGASRPVSLLLVPKEATADTPLRDRISLLVDGYGPNARIEASPSYANLDAGDDLRNVLVGLPPTDAASELLVELPHGMRAWRDGNVLWVRTPYRVTSPATKQHVAMGEMRAYKLPYLPVIVLAKDGRSEQISLVQH